MNEKHSPPSLIGTRFARPDAAAKVTGRAMYTEDLQFPDMLHGACKRSNCPRGRILGVHFDPDFDWSDTVIVQAADIPGPNALPILTTDQPVLAEDRINHPAEPVVLLAHKDPNVLKRALQCIIIDVEPEQAVTDLREAMRDECVIHGQSNCLKSYQIRKGNPDDIWAGAWKVVENDYQTGAQEQLYIEPQVMVAKPEAGGGLCFWGSMQCPYYIHKGLMPVFQLPAEKIRVIQCVTGGAFGGKEEYPSLLAAHAGLLALKSGHPVRMLYSREEDLLATTKRHPSYSRIKTALDREGHLLAMEFDFNLDGGAYTTLSPVVLSRGAIHAGGPYRCDHVRISASAWATNKPPMGAYRGFGAPQSIFALERQMDHCAEAAGLSPLEFRRRNLLRRGDTMATGQLLKEDPGWDGILEKALSESHYEERCREHLSHNRTSQPTTRGIGLATFMHGAGFTGSGEVHLASVVEAAILQEGLLEIRSSCVEMGQGCITVFSQIAADAAGLPPECMKIVNPDTQKVPDSGPTVASRTSMVVGHLVEEAVKALMDPLEQAGWKKGMGAASFAKACKQACQGKGELSCRSQYKAPPGIFWDDESYSGDAYAAWALAVYIAETETDRDTCETKVTSFTAVQEVGRVLNPVLAEGQIEGGVTQGIGWSLYEEVVWRDGGMANNRLSGYIIPTASDLPDLNVYFLEQPFAHGPGGAKGIGELPMDGPAPAICAALDMALDIRVTQVPALPEHLAELLAGGAE